jgi:hypothetical protein
MQQVQNVQSHRVSNTLAMTSFYNSGRISKVVFVITKLIKEIISILWTVSEVTCAKEF